LILSLVGLEEEAFSKSVEGLKSSFSGIQVEEPVNDKLFAKQEEGSDSSVIKSRLEMKQELAQSYKAKGYGIAEAFNQAEKDLKAEGK